MLNIKNYKSFSRPKTWKSVVEYDNHVYKEDRLLAKDNQNENVNLINNILDFEQQVKQYKTDLQDSYAKERYLKLKKTPQEVNKIYYSSGIMRSFRLSVNHIELDSLHQPDDNELQKRKNIINFYQSCLDEFQNVLNKNNKFDQKVQIVLADIHFDQTSPHMHIHVSNLRKMHLKKLNREVVACNVKQSDLLRMLNNEKIKLAKANGLKVSVNEIFAHQVKSQRLTQDWALINRIDLKKLYPEIYDVQLYKLKNNIKNWDVNVTKTKGLLKDNFESLNWRIDKEISFRMAKEQLKDLNLSIDNQNDIANRKKIDDVALYCWKQSLAVQIAKQQKLEHELALQDHQKTTEKQKFELDLSVINDNKYVQNLIQNSLKNDELNMEIIQANQLKDAQNSLLTNISVLCPELKSIENELINSLGLFKTQSQTNVLNNEEFIQKAQQFDFSYLISQDKTLKQQITISTQQTNNHDLNLMNQTNQALLASTEYLVAQNYKKAAVKDNVMPNFYDSDNAPKKKKSLGLSYNISETEELTQSFYKQKNVADIEREEELKKLKRDGLLRL